MRLIGCFLLCENVRKFRSKRKWNGSAQVEIFRSKCMVHLQRWSSLTGRSSPTENCGSIFRIVCSPAPARHHNQNGGFGADGSNVSVYECSVCKLLTQDLNFLLMHSKAQVQQCILICFFFWFLSVFKDKYITGFSAC